MCTLFQVTIGTALDRGSAAKVAREEVVTDLVKAFTAANIPLEKIDNEEIRKFFTKHVRNGGAIPKANQVREHYIDSVYSAHQTELQERVRGQPVAVCVDETTDVRQRYVVNILVKILDASASHAFLLIDTVFLERTNHSTVPIAVVHSLGEFGIKFEQVRAFISDSAPYMLKAYREVFAKLYTNSIHMTCWSHIIHLVGETWRCSFPSVDRMVALMKSLFSKSALRQNRYAEFLSEHGCKPSPCPQPVVTRWGTWLAACVYHAEHLHLYPEFVKQELDLGRTNVLLSLQELFSEEQLATLRRDTLFIASHAKVFSGCLFTLEKSDLLASETYDTLTRFSAYLESGKVETTEEEHCKAFTKSITKLDMYMKGKHPAMEFLRSARLFNPKKAEGMVLSVDNLQSVGGKLDECADDVKRELKLYEEIIKDDQVDKENVASFWKAMEAELPRLSKLAKITLACPSNSSAVERSFSKYAGILAPDRMQLKLENIKKLNMLYFNNGN